MWLELGYIGLLLKTVIKTNMAFSSVIVVTALLN